MKILIEVFVQTFLSFFSILIITRMLGRQQVAQLTVYEYINGITFGSIAATLATDLGQESWHHFLGLILFGALTYLMSTISLKSRRASRLIQGEPVLAIKDGKILEKNISKYHYTVDDLTHLLRKKDIFNIRDVKYAILETTGELSVLKVAEREVIRAEDLKVKVIQEELNLDIIVTGTIIYENLKQRNLSVKWLTGQLKSLGVRDIKEVFYATLDDKNKLYIDRMEDHLDKKDGIE